MKKKFFQFFFSLSAFNSQQVATHYKGQNKNRIMAIGQKLKVTQSSKMSRKMPKKLKIFSFKIHEGAEICKKKPEPF